MKVLLTRVVTMLLALLMSTFVFADWQSGIDAFKADHYDLAEAEFRKVIQEHPDYAGGYYMLAMCLRSGLVTKEKSEESRANVLRAHELDPENVNYLLAHAEAEIEARAYKEVYVLLTDVNTSDFEHEQRVRFRISLAEAAVGSDHATRAVDLIYQHINQQGESAFAYRLLGMAYDKLRLKEEAVDAFSRAFDLQRTDYMSAQRDVIRHFERTQQRLHSPPLSSRILRTATGLAWVDPTIENYLLAGKANLETENDQRALDWFDLALIQQPYDPETLYLSARALRRLERLGEANARLALALKCNPAPKITVKIRAEFQKLSELGFDLDAAEKQRRADMEERARLMTYLKSASAEPLAQRESYLKQAQDLREAEEETHSSGQREYGERAQTISELEGNIAIIDEELSQAYKTALAKPQSPESHRILQQLQANLQRKLTRLKPEDLELNPLGIDELVVIVRHEQPATITEAQGPPLLKAVVSEKEIAFPLRSTDVKADISGYIASVEVKQNYVNPYAEKIEAVYTFPLPHDASVNEFIMTIGQRKIRGIIRERAEAEKIYKAARKQGHVASLLTQERPNIFTQKISNIEPNKSIDITLTYYNTLPYRDGGYEFSFPTVIGPRFNPPESEDPIGAVPLHEKPADTTEVQYLSSDEFSSHKISLSIDLEAGTTITDVSSKTHVIAVEKVSATRRRIKLVNPNELPDRDFIVRWKVAEDMIKSAFLVHEHEDGDFFTLVLTPPESKTAISKSPVEHIFVIDCSGSMKGEPLKIAKRAVRKALDKLEPEDTFQIIRFSTEASSLGPKPIPATPSGVQSGFDYLDRLEGTGGTMMIEGIKAALDFPHAPGRVRLVSLMTDGFIGNEAEVLAAVHDKLGESRIFSFGVGSAPNRFLLESLAKLGQGAVAYVTADNKVTDPAIDVFFERMSHPVFNGIKINWEETEVTEVYPLRIPDMHLSQPVILSGRFKGTAGKYITVSGFQGGKATRFSVPLYPYEHKAGPELTQIWARLKIADLAQRSLWASKRDVLVKEIRQLALDFGLMSKYTAFLAVDSLSATTDGQDVSVAQAVPLPAGVSFEMTVGQEEQEQRQ